MKIYTRTGDDGSTGLMGNKRVRKDDVRLEAYGTIDELNASLGCLLSQLPTATDLLRNQINAIQSDLFIIGTLLATPAEAPSKISLPHDRISFLEMAIDEMEKDLPPLKNFVLPQGSEAGAFAHWARTVCRRAERHVVGLAGYDAVPEMILAYLNRLSDWLFVAARWINQDEKAPEILWTHGDPSETVTPTPPTGDRLSATLQKLEHEKEKRKTLFEKSAADLQKKREAAEKLFRTNVNQVQKEGGKVEKPLRDFDLD